ncbi:MAG: RecX family transcriptional regulator [Gaiellales bacterium]
MAARIITAVRSRDDQRLTVELDGKAWITLDPVTAARLGLHVDRTLAPGEVAAAEEAARSEQALLRGAALVGQRSHARGELERRLARRAGDDAAQTAVERLADLGIVDDERHASELTAHRLRAGWGPARIEHDLRAAGVAETLIRCTLDELDDDALDAAARVALGARSGAAGWQRLAARGFDEAVAERLLGTPDLL